ncbi:MAG TPA: aminotransferase class I/II-fold pyridoxal phosphate-dependent enzyme [Anaerolineales bacterium]|nr:aminotransferase class I/II-fold pyridoxal phosphate-dependent enzyme [Anaerolineales bacterium]
MRDFVARRVAAVPPSGIRRFFDITATMEDVISLGIGEPDFVTPKPILEAGIRSLQEGHTSYTSNSGTIELRQTLAAHLQRLYSVSYDPEKELLITVGVSEALYLALTAILDPGDEVIVPTPCFVAYQPEVTFAGGVPVPLHTRVEDDFQVRAADVEARLTPKTKALLIGYPNNPTGAVMTREHLLELAALAERHDLLIVSDEIYDRLVYGGHRHVCFAALPGMRERSITLGGFSKDYAMTGWRIGYAAAPAAILDAMRKVHQYTIMSAPTTAQAAALEALLHGEEHVQTMVAEYDRRRRLIVKGLNELGMRTFEPKGAFYAFPSIAASGMSDEDFANRLLQEERVAVVPGNAFGADGGFVRCSYATAYEKIEEALERMRRFMARHG